MNGGRGKARMIMLGGSAAGLAVTALLVLWMVQGAPPRGGSRDERPLEGLQVFGTVPPFSLIERSGLRVTREDLMGRVWIVNFIYTHCPDTCPLQTANMARLQRDLKDLRNLHLVSITVDPERDTPPVLREYADRYGADAARWLFLTGQKKAIYRLAREGFHLGAGFPNDQAQGPAGGRAHPVARLLVPAQAWAHAEDFGKETLPHSSRFVLVDREARIRGYYPGTDVEAFQRLRQDVCILLQREE